MVGVASSKPLLETYVRYLQTHTQILDSPLHGFRRTMAATEHKQKIPAVSAVAFLLTTSAGDGGCLPPPIGFSIHFDAGSVSCRQHDE